VGGGARTRRGRRPLQPRGDGGHALPGGTERRPRARAPARPLPGGLPALLDRGPDGGPGPLHPSPGPERGAALALPDLARWPFDPVAGPSRPAGRGTAQA
jgi:hypothetical protein